MAAGVRLDKWLWFCRFFKTRGLAQKAVADGGVWVNGIMMDKPARHVRIGDVVIFPAGPYWRQVRVVALGQRRGPAIEAQLLYGDDVFVTQPL